MRRKIFQNIFFAAMAVFLLGMTCAVWTLYTYFSRLHFEALENEATYLAAAINSYGADFLDVLPDSAGSARITRVAADGTVLFDSVGGAEAMENHAYREEIRQALDEGRGSSIRFSPTSGKRTANFALRLADGTVIRASANLFTVGILLLNLFTPMLLVLVLAIVLSFLLAARLSRQIIQPLGKIDLRNPDDREVYDELKPLVQRIRGQNRKIHEQVEALKREHSRQDDMRREFTANVSHELKTPLTSISGYAELLQNGLVKPEDTARFGERIYREAQRLIVLVNDIIRLSRLEDKDVTDKSERIALTVLCREVCGALYDAARQRQVTLEVRGEECSIVGVRQLAYLLTSNLCDNAIKYNRPGGSVIMTVGRREDRVMLEVRDTGIGIPKDELDRVFERFYRVDKSHSKEVGGTGLGLSIVKHGAAYLGALLEIESEENEGTAIRVLFPAEPEPAAED